MAPISWMNTLFKMNHSTLILSSTKDMPSSRNQPTEGVGRGAGADTVAILLLANDAAGGALIPCLSIWKILRVGCAGKCNHPANFTTRSLCQPLRWRTFSKPFGFFESMFNSFRTESLLSIMSIILGPRSRLYHADALQGSPI